MYDKYIGKKLDDRYEILERIGTGGMAVVYKGTDHRLNRFVAIKILKEEFADDEELVRRFHTESQAVAMLSHPNIVSVYDVNRFENTEYIVMELIEGITLKQYINRKGVLSAKETLHFATQITKALIHAHSRGIIHRDIKPHNIMILRDGSVKVADFGIAQLITASNNTLTKQALGSVHYISPEQAKGGHVDARSDIYSVGVVMYEMLTNRLPFEGESAVSIAIQHISSIPLMPREIIPTIPVGLENITMHAMEPDLSLRYANAGELLRDLEEFRKNPAIVFPYFYRGITAAVQSPAEKPQQSAVNQPRQQSETHSGNVSAQQHVKPVETEKRTVTDSKYYSKEYDDDYTADLDKKYRRRDIDRENKKKANRVTLLMGILGVCLFIVVLFVIAWNSFLRDLFNPNSKEVEVPQFVGQAYDYITKSNQYSEFNITPEYDYSDDVAQGLVMKQSLSEGRMLAVSDTGIDITLWVSLGEEPGDAMGNLIGMDYRFAQNYLEKLNLNLNIKTQMEYSDTVTEGYVISTIPEAGDDLVPNSTVYITYSGGPEVHMTVVPNVTGVSLSTAQARLENRDLTWEVEEIEDEAEKGIVVYQSYPEGEEVPAHTQLKLQVSLGKEPEVVEVAVPNVVGSDLSEAITVLTNSKLHYETFYVESSEPNGKVVFQSVSTGTMVPEETTITLHVSSGYQTVIVDPTQSGSSQDPETDMPSYPGTTNPGDFIVEPGSDGQQSSDD